MIEISKNEGVMIIENPYFSEEETNMCQICRIEEAKYEMEDIIFCDECVSSKILEDGMAEDMIILGYYPFFSPQELHNRVYTLIHDINDCDLSDDAILGSALDLIREQKKVIIQSVTVDSGIKNYRIFSKV